MRDENRDRSLDNGLFQQPARQFRFTRPVVYVSRDVGTGGLLIVERPSVEEVFAALDAAQLPDDFLGEADRDQRPPDVRPRLTTLVLGKRHDIHPPGRYEHLQLHRRR